MHAWVLVSKQLILRIGSMQPHDQVRALLCNTMDEERPCRHGRKPPHPMEHSLNVSQVIASCRQCRDRTRVPGMVWIGDRLQRSASG